MKNISSTLSLPNPTPWLLLMAAAITWVSLRPGAESTRMWFLVVMLAPVAAAAVYFFARRAEVAAMALIAGSAMPRYFFQVGGMKARPEHLVAGLLCIAAVFIYKRNQEPPRWIFADVLLLAYVALNIFSSAFMSVEPAQTLKWSVQQMLVVGTYFLVRLLAGNVERFRLAVKIMVVVGSVEGLYAAVSFYSNLLFGTEFGLDPSQYEHVSGVYGTQFEANLLGSYCAACLIIMLVIFFRNAEGKYLWGIGLTYAGLLISFSRAALMAAAVAMVVLVIYTMVARAVNRSTVVKVAAVLLLVSLVVGATLLPFYIERFSTLDASDPSADENTRVRLLTLAAALEHIRESPVFGSGTSSFQLMFDLRDFGYDEEQSAGWISNTEVRILHDTGALGLLVFSGFVLYLIIRGIRCARRSRSPEIIGLLLSSVVYVLSFQATEGTLLAFSWVHLGLIAAAIAVYADQNAGADALQAAAASKA